MREEKAIFNFFAEIGEEIIIRSQRKKREIIEIVVGAIFSLIFIMGLFLHEGFFLELLFRFHKTVIFSIILLVVVMEAIYIVRGLLEQRKYLELISHVVVSLTLFLILFVVNLGVYEKVVGPKLTTIEILEPKDGGEVLKPITEVKFFVRNAKWSIYLIVETPQGTQWIQAKRLIPNNQFKATLTQAVRLGEGYIGIGETFKIFAIGTKEDLDIGLIEKIPPYSIVSNMVTVKRIE
jgi:hypothetical protein